MIVAQPMQGDAIAPRSVTGLQQRRKGPDTHALPSVESLWLTCVK